MLFASLDTASSSFVVSHGVQINGGYHFLSVFDLLHLFHTSIAQTTIRLVSATLLVLCNIQIIGLDLLLGERQWLCVQKVVHGASIAI